MRTFSLVSAAAFIASVALSAAAAGQETATPQRTQADLTTLPTVARVASPGLAMSLDATSDEKRGSVAVAFANADDSLTFAITASGPLDKDTREAHPLSLEGLASDAAVEFGLNWFHWPGTPDPLAARNFCIQATGQPDCDDDMLSESDRAAFLSLTYADRNPWIVNGTASLGRSEFTYLNRANLAGATEHHNDGALGFSIGQYAPLRGYIAFGYEFAREWQPGGAARQICFPLANSVPGSEECRSAVLAPPSVQQSHLAKVQWRKFFNRGRLAINPSVARDFGDGVTAATAPVYFFSNSNGGLAGGAKIGWRSDTNDLTFTIFVGTALAITD